MKRAVQSAIVLMLSAIVVIAISAASAGGATVKARVDVNIRHAGESRRRGTFRSRR